LNFIQPRETFFPLFWLCKKLFPKISSLAATKATEASQPKSPQSLISDQPLETTESSQSATPPSSRDEQLIDDLANVMDIPENEEAMVANLACVSLLSLYICRTV
jgi:hypothetical protein